MSNAERLARIADGLRGHVPCGFEICEQATNLVPGAGNPDAQVVFVGEAPGANEDKQGVPFVGAAGKLLDELLEHANLVRDDVFITNVVKARPPKNRDPRPDEVAHHWPWLEQQLEVIRPRLIVPLGRHAMGRFLEGVTITEAHGTPVSDPAHPGRTIVPWYHPAAAIYNRSLREALVEDATRLGQTLGTA